MELGFMSKHSIEVHIIFPPWPFVRQIYLTTTSESLRHLQLRPHSVDDRVDGISSCCSSRTHGSCITELLCKVLYMVLL